MSKAILSASERELLRHARELGYEVKGRNCNNHLALWHPRGGTQLIPRKCGRGDIGRGTLAKLRRAIGEAEAAR